MKTPTQIIDEIDRRKAHKREAIMKIVLNDQHDSVIGRRTITLLEAELAELQSLREFLLLP